jgi:uncharacterized protein (DUF1501 family)
MNRRLFLQRGIQTSLAATSAPVLSYLVNPVEALAQAAAPAATAAADSKGKYQNLLILIELKGANDGLNTVVPYTDPRYAQLRPRIALPGDQLLKISDREGLHPSLAPIMPLWEKKELAVVQGLGYPNPNLSHFRSIEIWDTASKSEEYLDAGWLARAFQQQPAPKAFAADGVVVGSSDMGPLSGGGTRTIALADTRQFLQQARLAQTSADQRNAALKHIMNTENEIVHAANKLNTNFEFKTEFARSPFGNQVRTAAQLVASKAGVAVIRLSLTGFDTHANQLGPHANLLKEVSQGIATLKAALTELNRWDSTLIMTYAEFGRRPKENQSGGTDHGTSNVHFVAGGKVTGGLYGDAPALNRLDGNGNLPFAVDFRNMYATVIDQWWGGDASRVLNGKFEKMGWLKA